MEKRRLGNSDLEITRIGFGAWAIGGSWDWGWGDQDDAASIMTLHQALDRGINWIDTAAIYGLGHSEEVVRQALAQTDAHPYVFTKCSLIWNAKKSIRNSLKADSVRREVEQSLTRLGVETIDLYQIHWPIPKQQIEEGWETLVQLKEEGKVRHIGVSNFSVAQLKKIGAIAPVTSLQPPYSLVHPEVGEEILPYCLDQEIGVICYSPMASGMLSGKMTRERIEQLDPTDWRHKSDDFKEPVLTRNLALQETCRKIGEKHGRTAGEIAIAWVLENPAVTGAIVGMRGPDQVDGVVNASTVQLDDDDRAALKNV